MGDATPRLRSLFPLAAGLSSAPQPDMVHRAAWRSGLKSSPTRSDDGGC